MKKINLLLLTAISTIVLSGCATVDAIKKDSAKTWNVTKKVSKTAYQETKEAIKK